MFQNFFRRGDFDRPSTDAKVIRTMTDSFRWQKGFDKKKNIV
jgi:hypothetical protein